VATCLVIKLIGVPGAGSRHCEKRIGMDKKNTNIVEKIMGK
jgi:hypothetical protein